MRYFYTIIKAWQFYSALKNITQDKSRVFSQITEITVDHLKRLEIKILVLDFDGVLNSHGEPLPRLDVVEWLKPIQAGMGADNIFILSNKPLPARLQFFTTYFPGIQFIQGVRKKPYPDGLEKVFQLKNIFGEARRQVALVDDRLLTGMLATCITGCQGLYIREPYIQLNKRPIVETFFQALRWFERLLIEKGPS